MHPEDLADPDEWVEYAALVRLWTAVLDRFPDRPIGLTLARRISEATVGMLGVIGYATRHCREPSFSSALCRR